MKSRVVAWAIVAMAAWQVFEEFRKDGDDFFLWLIVALFAFSEACSTGRARREAARELLAEVEQQSPKQLSDSEATHDHAVCVATHVGEIVNTLEPVRQATLNQFHTHLGTGISHEGAEEMALLFYNETVASVLAGVECRG